MICLYDTHTQVSPLADLDEDWKNVTADSLFSKGEQPPQTLRSKISIMMKQIHQKLEKLSLIDECVLNLSRFILKFKGPLLQLPHNTLYFFHRTQ